MVKRVQKILGLLLAVLVLLAAMPAAFADEAAAEEAVIVTENDGEATVLPETDIAENEPESGDEEDADPVIPAACEEHEIAAWTANGDGTHTGECAVCGESVTEDCTGDHADACEVCGFRCTGSKTNSVTKTAPVWMESDGEIEYVCRTCGRHVSDAGVPGAADTVAITVYEKTGDGEAEAVKAFTIADLDALLQVNENGYNYTNGSGVIVATEYVELAALIEEAGIELANDDTVTAAASDGFGYSATVSYMAEHGYYFDGEAESAVPAVIAVKWGDSAAEAYYSGNLRSLMGTTATGADGQGRRLVSNVVSVTVEHPAPAVTVTLSDDYKTAKLENGYDGLYARVALVLEMGDQSGLHVTQAAINDDGTIVIPAFMVPGVVVKGVSVAIVDDLANITAAEITPIAHAFAQF